MTFTIYIAAGFVFVCCILFRHVLEADPVTHVLVQLPLLVWCGAVMASYVVNSKANWPEANWNKTGIAPLLLAIFAAAFWMLPRSIDSAITSPLMAVAKYISLPLLVGVPLAIGWARAHPLLKGFLKAQSISMLGVLAFLYTYSPVRICNVYLVDDQVRLGTGFLVAAVVLALIWTVPLLGVGTSRSAARVEVEKPI